MISKVCLMIRVERVSPCLSAAVHDKIGQRPAHRGKISGMVVMPFSTTFKEYRYKEMIPSRPIVSVGSSLFDHIHRVTVIWYDRYRTRQMSSFLNCSLTS